MINLKCNNFFLASQEFKLNLFLLLLFSLNFLQYFGIPCERVLQLFLNPLVLLLSNHFIDSLLNLFLVMLQRILMLLSEDIDLLRTVVDLVRTLVDLPLQSNIFLLNLLVLFLKNVYLFLIFGFCLFQHFINL